MNKIRREIYLKKINNENKTPKKLNKYKSLIRKPQIYKIRKQNIVRIENIKNVIYESFRHSKMMLKHPKTKYIKKLKSCKVASYEKFRKQPMARIEKY